MKTASAICMARSPVGDHYHYTNVCGEIAIGGFCSTVPRVAVHTRRFAGTGLNCGHDIFTGKDGRDRLALDRERFCVALLLDGRPLVTDMNRLFRLLGEELVELFRDTCLKTTQFPGVRMCENKTLGVQRKAADRFYLRAIFDVAHHRVPDILHVYANLVFTPCFEVYLEQRKIPGALKRLVVGDSFLAVVGVLRRVDGEGIALVQERADGSTSSFDLTLYNSDVGSFLDGREPCLLNLVFNFFVFCKEQEA